MKLRECWQNLVCPGTIKLVLNIMRSLRQWLELNLAVLFPSIYRYKGLRQRHIASIRVLCNLLWNSVMGTSFKLMKVLDLCNLAWEKSKGVKLIWVGKT